MGLLKPAENGTAFLKAGLFGFPGTGKTRTACELAMGLADLEKAKKVAFFDTESGSDYMVPLFKERGIELLVHKGRAFKDLLSVIRECQDAGIKVLVLDSVTHIWKDLVDSYIKRLSRRNGLQFQDWGVLKTEWQQYSDAYLNSKMHILMCGRAGFEYDTQKNDDTGKQEIIKSGTKMKVETEMGFEPSLLIEMELSEDPKTRKQINVAYIRKDRTDKLNGKEIKMPLFKDFLPVIQFLNIGGTHSGVDVTRNSQDIFENPDYSWTEMKKQKEILFEEIKDYLVKHDLGGTSDKSKKAKIELMEAVFGTSSGRAIEDLKLGQLSAGFQKMKAIVEPEKYPQQVHVEESIKADAIPF